MDRLFFYLLLILLPTQLGFHMWPEWAMVLGRRVDYLSPTIYLTDLLILGILLFWRPKKISPLTIPIAIFALINILTATSPLVSSYMWLKVTEFYFLFLYIKETKPKLSRVVYYVTFGVLYSAGIAILQFVFQHSLGLWVLGERTFTAESPGIARITIGSFYKLRSYATFPHPNVLGGFFAVMIPLLVYEYPKKKFLYGSAIVASCIGLLVSFGRSALVALFIGLGKIFLLAAIVAALFLGRFIGLNDESLVVREQLNQSAIEMFFDRPITGVGLGNYLVELPNHLVSRQIYFLQPVHNIYLLVLAQTGVVGFGLFVWLLVWALRKNSIVRQALLALLFIGLVDHYPLTLQQGQLLFTILIAESTIAS